MAKLVDVPVGTRVEWVSEKIMERSYYGQTIVLRRGHQGVVTKQNTSGYVWVEWDHARSYGWDVWTYNIEPIADEKESQDSILKIAESLVYGDRQDDYGHPKQDMDRTAKMWSAVLGFEVTAEQVALCMCCVKISRQVNERKRDNLIDLAGYAEVTDRIIRYEEGDVNS